MGQWLGCRAGFEGLERLWGLNNITSTLFVAEAGTRRPRGSHSGRLAASPTLAGPAPPQLPPGGSSKEGLTGGGHLPASQSRVLIMVYCEAAFHAELFRRAIPKSWPSLRPLSLPGSLYDQYRKMKEKKKGDCHSQHGRLSTCPISGASNHGTTELVHGFKCSVPEGSPSHRQRFLVWHFLPWPWEVFLT